VNTVSCIDCDEPAAETWVCTPCYERLIEDGARYTDYHGRGWLDSRENIDSYTVARGVKP
jgi:hypothetical protein